MNVTCEVATRYGLKKKAVIGKTRIAVDLNQMKLTFSPSRYHFLMEALNSLAKVAPSSAPKTKEGSQQSWMEKKAANIQTHGYVYISLLDGIALASSVNSRARPVFLCYAHTYIQ